MEYAMKFNTIEQETMNSILKYPRVKPMRINSSLDQFL